MTKQIRGNMEDNSKILSQFLNENLRQAQIKKYGKPLFTFHVEKEESAQSLIDDCEDDQ